VRRRLSADRTQQVMREVVSTCLAPALTLWALALLCSLRPIDAEITTYASSFRHTAPAIPSSPLPTRSMLLGSGTVDGVLSDQINSALAPFASCENLMTSVIWPFSVKTTSPGTIVKPSSFVGPFSVTQVSRSGHVTIPSLTSEYRIDPLVGNPGCPAIGTYARPFIASVPTSGTTS
jgi:hypothetical protein